MERLNRLTGLLLGTLLAGALAGTTADAEDPVSPTIRSFAGAFIGAGSHNFFVESELRLPIVEIGPAVVDFHYRESTPFLRETGGPQAEVLARRQDLEINWKLTDAYYLLAVGGYRSTYQVDRPGFLSAGTIGGGFGSGPPRPRQRFWWSATAGGLVATEGIHRNWWTDLHAEWYVFDFASERYLDSSFNASVSLVADFETVNGNSRIEPFYRVGPAFQVLTVNGNRAQFQLLWYHNDNNSFLGMDENAFLFGLDISSPQDRDEFMHAATERRPGWMPLIWGAYDVGFAASRRIARFEMNVELIDVKIADRLLTGFIWYESRQEYRPNDFDNIAYSVTLGVQTPVGLASFASHDDPLVFGADFLHRSDHALNPGANRIPPGGELNNGSHNLLPRLRLQTTGWDLPYRDAHMYDRQTKWLNIFDWRITGGWDINDDRNRGKLAGQLGLNWDVATVQGYVVYLRGQRSAGNETPDWLGECGVRRPIGRIFARYEDYGIKRDIAQGKTFTVGIGVNL